MLKKRIPLISLSIIAITLLSGCLFNRHDPGPPPKTYSNTVFLMPTILDLTLDPEISISGKKLQDNIDRAHNKLIELARDELGRRGYYLMQTIKKESDLSLSSEYDLIIKNALNDFRSLRPHNYEGVQYTLPQAIDKVIEKHEGGDKFHIDTIHYLLFLQIESNLAKNRVFHTTHSDAFVRLRLELVDIRHAEIITFRQDTIRGKSLLNIDETRLLLRELLGSVPMNLISEKHRLKGTVKKKEKPNTKSKAKQAAVTSPTPSAPKSEIKKPTLPPPTIKPKK